MEIQANWELVIMLVPYNPVGLLVHLVEHWIGIAEVMGSNPVRARIFSGLIFHYCSSSAYYCEDRFHIHVFIRSSQIWFSYIHS